MLDNSFDEHPLYKTFCGDKAVVKLSSTNLRISVLLETGEIAVFYDSFISGSISGRVSGILSVSLSGILSGRLSDILSVYQVFFQVVCLVYYQILAQSEILKNYSRGYAFDNIGLVYAL